MNSNASRGARYAQLVVVAVVSLLVVLATIGVKSAHASEFERFGVESASVGVTTTQAGAHPDLTTTFVLANDGTNPYALLDNARIEVPPGVVGNPQQIPRCSIQQLGSTTEESECPIQSQVGVTEITVGGISAGTFVEPIYNMTPSGSNVVARLGFFARVFPTIINLEINPVTYALVANIEGAAAAAKVISAKTTLWGIPAAPVHDPLRITPEEARSGGAPPGGRPAGVPETPFVTNPSACGSPGSMSVTATSYQEAGAPRTATTPFPAITGCGRLSFEPRLGVVATNPVASSPTGVDVELEVPQDEGPSSLATSTLRSAVVTLPSGLAINSAAGDGLEACSAEQVGFETTRESECPPASKIGTAEIEVPALEHMLRGAVYQRTPEPGHLFRFWLVTDEQGVHLKLPAEIEADSQTGQLTTVFKGLPALDGLPPLPYTNLKLHIFGGPRAPLMTPASCGTYQTHYAFTPWSGKASVEGNSPMTISGGCQPPGFSPGLTAGTTQTSAGSYSPFTLDLSRRDGEGNPSDLAVQLPSGLLAKLVGVALCPESSAAGGACPASSQVGTVSVATGVGGTPLWIPQPGKDPTAVYLAGPYKGGPYSLIIKVPAQAGPFDLGTVVTRAAIQVDPLTTQVTVASDPLPQILEGVPVTYRDIHVDIDRPQFTLNATNCSSKTIAARVTSTTGAVANPSVGYQPTNCAILAFEPTLKLFLTGQTKRTGYPAIKAVMTQPKKANANLGGASVILPKGMLIANAHINNPCTRVQFNSTAIPGQGCPPKSILGTAKVWTPLLETPEEGNVYFRSNGGERQLPDLVVALQGQIPIQLVGFIDSVGKKGAEVRRVRTRFQNVPDAPFTRFELKLSGGKKGLLENSKNLCKAGDRTIFALTGQNGKVHDTEPKVQVSCGKGKAAKN
jgi:hypothetical protein